MLCLLLALTKEIMSSVLFRVLGLSKKLLAIYECPTLFSWDTVVNQTCKMQSVEQSDGSTFEKTL